MSKMKNIEIRKKDFPLDDFVVFYEVGFSQLYYWGDELRERFLPRASFRINEKDNHYVLLANRSSIGKKDFDDPLFGVNEMNELNVAEQRIKDFTNNYALALKEDYLDRKDKILEIIFS